MAKTKPITEVKFVCAACGYGQSRKLRCCPNCQHRGSMVPFSQRPPATEDDYPNEYYKSQKEKP